MDNHLLYKMNVAENELIKASEYAMFPIDLSWTLDYCMGQDADYIIRKKALKFALSELADEGISEMAKQLLIAQIKEESQQDSTQNFNKKDFSWTLDCPAILQ